MLQHLDLDWISAGQLVSAQGWTRIVGASASFKLMVSCAVPRNSRHYEKGDSDNMFDVSYVLKTVVKYCIRMINIGTKHREVLSKC